jgi:hypothetical protein
MSCLENTRHERFAQFMAQGLKAQDAYEQAGFKVGSRNAFKLMREYPEIERRIKQLQNKRERKMMEDDITDIIDKTEASRILSEMARSNNYTENGRRLALAVLARMYGWYQPQELKIKNGTDMSDAELEKIITAPPRKYNLAQFIREAHEEAAEEGGNITKEELATTESAERSEADEVSEEDNSDMFNE